VAHEGQLGVLYSDLSKTTIAEPNATVVFPTY
jgi:hypothetical protein